MENFYKILMISSLVIDILVIIGGIIGMFFLLPYRLKQLETAVNFIRTNELVCLKKDVKEVSNQINHIQGWINGKKK